MVRNEPRKWDMEADLVAVGAGAGGLAAAITARDHGLSAFVLERSDEVGGVTAYSMGYGDDRAILNQAIHGPVALKYFESAIGLKMQVIRNFPDYYFPHNNNSVAEGRYLEVEPFPADTLGEWQHRTRLTPHLPAGLTHEDIFHGGGLANMLGWDYELLADRITKDLRCLGPGLAAYFVKGALDRNIPLYTDTSVEEL